MPPQPGLFLGWPQGTSGGCVGTIGRAPGGVPLAAGGLASALRATGLMKGTAMDGGGRLLWGLSPRSV